MRPANITITRKNLEEFLDELIKFNEPEKKEELLFFSTFTGLWYKFNYTTHEKFNSDAVDGPWSLCSHTPIDSLIE